MRPEDWEGEDIEELEDAEWVVCERCGGTWELSDLRMDHDMMLCPDCRQELDDKGEKGICVTCSAEWPVDELSSGRVCPDCIEDYEED